MTPTIVLTPNTATQIEMLRNAPRDASPDRLVNTPIKPTEEDLDYIKEITKRLPPVPITQGETDLVKDRKERRVAILGKELRAETIADTKKALESTDERLPCTGCERLFLRSQVLPMFPEFDDW